MRAITITSAVIAGMLLAIACSLVGCVPGVASDPANSAKERSVDIRVASSAFEDGGGAGRIPAKYAMKGVPGGENVSLPYSWNGVPSSTKSLALTLVDTAPVARDWVHWMVIDISADATGVAEGASGTSRMPDGAVELRNTFGFTGYGGPQPPSGTGSHAYVATVYALDVPALGLPAEASLAQFKRAIAGHVLATGALSGRFER